MITGKIPINKIKDSTDECGSKKDSGLLIITSPYSWPKFIGPEPNNSSIKVGLYLAKNKPHISDLLRKYAIVLKKPKIPLNNEFVSNPLFNNLK